MRTLKKNIAAGVLGAVLLAGVGGTFALWTAESDPAPIGSIQAGEMTVEIGDQATWNVAGGLSDGDYVYLSDILMIPGDVVTGVFPVTADFRATSAITATVSAGDIAGVEDGDLDIRPTETAGIWRVYDVSDATGTPEGRPTSFTVQIGDLSSAVLGNNLGEGAPAPTFTVIVRFEAGEAGDANADMNLAGELGYVTVTLTQVVPDNINGGNN
jgi:alternate signal-mediated exported protein